MVSFILWKNREENKKESSASVYSYDEVLQLRKEHYCGSVSISYSNSGPLLIVGGSQSYLIDHNGKYYLDTRNNVAHVGHQNPQVIKAIKKQIDRLNTNSRYIHPNSSLLAKRLVDLLPKPLSKVFFVNSGSEANDLALRLARAYTGSKNSIVVDCAYHGHTMNTLEISPYKFDCSSEFDLIEQHNGYKTPGGNIYKVSCPNSYRGRYHRGGTCKNVYNRYVGDPEYDFANEVETACHYYQHVKNEKVGCFIIEGGMSVGGVILPPKSYLKRCAEAVRDAGGLYISDEVQTGFGRLGECFWAFQYNNSGVIPDIVTVGKPFGNGMPLAAVITTKEISDAFELMNVEYFNTFGGNPVSCAAGLAMLDELESKNFQEHALVVGNYMISKFRHLQEKHSIIGDIRGSGLFIGIELVRDRKTLEPATKETSFLCTVLKEKYFILTSIDGPFENVIVVKPPLCFDDVCVDIFIVGFESALIEDLSQIDLQRISKTPT